MCNYEFGRGNVYSPCADCTAKRPSPASSEPSEGKGAIDPLPDRRFTMKLNEAVARACQEPTLVNALSWIAVWENDRAVHQAMKGERGPDGRLWDTCFRVCFAEVMKEWERSRAAQPRAISKTETAAATCPCGHPASVHGETWCREPKCLCLGFGVGVDDPETEQAMSEAKPAANEADVVAQRESWAAGELGIERLAVKGERPGTWRVGHKQPRNLYEGDDYRGVMFSSDDAARVVKAMNEQRAPEGEAGGLTSEEWGALSWCVAGEQDDDVQRSLARNALRKLNARAGVEIGKQASACLRCKKTGFEPNGETGWRFCECSLGEMVRKMASSAMLGTFPANPESPGEAGGTDEEGGEVRMYEAMRAVVGGRDGGSAMFWPPWDDLPPVRREAYRVAYRFVRAESEGRIRELTEMLEGVGTENSELRAQRARMHCENAGLSDGLERCESDLNATKEKLHASESRVKALEGQVAEMLGRCETKP